MITLQEINPHHYAVSPEVFSHLQTLLTRINLIRTVWAKPMIVTSGLRSVADQMRIHPQAPHSKHLLGAACDILDTSGTLQAWLKAEPHWLQEAQLWCEEGTRGWVHFQCIAPASGHRWFIP